MTLKLIKKTIDPKFLIITPLKPGDEISTDTLRSVYNNRVMYDWYSYTDDRNIPLNTENGLVAYEKKHRQLPYIIKIDSHTTWKKGTLDKMYRTMMHTQDHEAYVYCSFEFVRNGLPVVSFKNINFDIDRLKKMNYISSNSMIKRRHLDICPFIIDDQYVRLLDYAHWLSFLKEGYHGKLSDGHFSSEMKIDNISSGDNEDFQLKLNRVHKDFL